MNKDELHEQSRFIRKAANEGKSYTDIMSTLHLTKAQIKYRLTSRYSERISSTIIHKLEENSRSKTSNSNRDYSLKIANSYTPVFDESYLVLDTSALNCCNFQQTIGRYAHIILTLDVIQELDKLKKDTGIFGINIRFILSQSANDVEAKKYQVIATQRYSNYTDDNLIHFCKTSKTTLYTGDHALANKAKAFGVPYILAKREHPLQEKETVSAIDVANLQSSLQSLSGNTTLDNVRLEGKFLILTLPDTYKIAYAVLDKEGNVKKPFAKNMIKLAIGDTLLIITHKLQNQLCISQYDIVNLQNTQHAHFIGAVRVQSQEDINKLAYPQSVLRDIRNFAIATPGKDKLKYYQ